jgi:hypothetical protein
VAQAGVASSTEALLRVHRIVRGIVGTEVSDEQPLMEAGLGSLGAVDLRSQLSEVSSCRAPPGDLPHRPTGCGAFGSYGLLHALSLDVHCRAAPCAGVWRRTASDRGL